MWIKKTEYKFLVQSRDSLMKQLESCQCATNMIQRKMNALDKLYKETKAEADLNKNLLEEYKQKYADEVQKRLELIKLYEENPNKETVS